MSARQIKGFLLLTSALGAITLIAGSSGAAPEVVSVSELLDPGVVAAGVCGPSGKHATTFKPVQLALVSSAEPSPAMRRIRRCGRVSAR